MKVPIKKSYDIEGMKKACKLTALILDRVGEIIKPGVSTEEINTFVHKATIDAGALPAPLNYKGFPKSVCTSLNDVVCHGIPSTDDVLKLGDIINVDVTSIVDGYFGDSSRMYLVGGAESCSKDALELVDITKKALYKGIAEVKPGAFTGDIGAGIQEYVESTGKNYGIVREYTGHGIGKAFHEPPQILHFGKRGTGQQLSAGMTFTVEPMLNIGTPYTKLSSEDGWTVRTADGELSAQWEHTVLVTDYGVEVLTQSDLF